MNHASIIPLIGGITLAQHEVTGIPPEYLMTYTGFQANESHLLHYYKQKHGIELPYYFVDRGEFPAKKVDVINTVCPCAGLSTLSTKFGEDNKNNQWMLKTTKFVLEEMKPRVFWGENAPGFAGKIGAPIREAMYKMARENGYTMTVYRTRSLLHATPQVRERSFYFFWKGDEVPVFQYYDRPYKTIQDTITSVKSNFMNEPINAKKPSEDPYYQYILEEIEGGIDHSEMMKRFISPETKSTDVYTYIEDRGVDYKTVGKWMKRKKYEREVVKCEYKHDKLARGMNVMRRGTILPSTRIEAFVGHLPTCIAHPTFDRYITYREAMTIMGLPQDYELLEPKKSYNHICQNVPFETAKDMATEVMAVLDGKREMIRANKLFQYNAQRTYDIIDGHNKSVLEFV